MAGAGPADGPTDESGLTGGRQHHVGVAEGEVADVVLMPGDPFRVALVAEQLDDVVEVAHQREHRTVNGTYRGVPVTVCSSGMGCPSTAIGVEELASAGARTFVRVGSTAALQPGMAIGDLLVSEGAFRNDGTTSAYVPAGHPAVPDLALTSALVAAARRGGREGGYGVHVGLNATDDAFWAETPEWIATLSGLGILNVEMEASAMFVVARRRGLAAGMVCAVSGNLVTDDVLRQAQRRARGGLARLHHGGAGGRPHPAGLTGAGRPGAGQALRQAAASRRARCARSSPGTATASRRRGGTATRRRMIA